METAVLGKTGLDVTRLGAGLAEVGEEHTLDELPHVGRVLNGALDGGINFLDTAPCYFHSEEMVGRTIAHRRDEYVLATKCGHPVKRSSAEPWSAKTIRETLDGSLRRLKTDYVDLLQLHSCGVDVLERGEAIEALMEAKRAGKTRFVGYSGDKHNPNYADEYHERAQVMADMGPVPDAPDDRILTSLGFVLAHDEVDTAILGTRNPAHMAANLQLVERMPIPDEVVEELRRRFDEAENDWRQLN